MCRECGAAPRQGRSWLCQNCRRAHRLASRNAAQRARRQRARQQQAPEGAAPDDPGPASPQAAMAPDGRRAASGAADAHELAVAQARVAAAAAVVRDLQHLIDIGGRTRAQAMPLHTVKAFAERLARALTQ